MSTEENDKDAKIQNLQKRVADLEAENARLTQQLAHLRSNTIPPLWGTRVGGGVGGVAMGSSHASQQTVETSSGRGGIRSANTAVRDARPQSSPALPGSLSSDLLGISIHANSASLVGAGGPLLVRTKSAPFMSDTTTTSSTGTTLTSTTTVVIPEGHELCDSCSRPIPSSSFSMHKIHCARNISKCEFCGISLPTRELPPHLSTARGTLSSLMIALVAGDVQTLQGMFTHGISPSAPCDTSSGDTPIHIAARNRNLIVLDYLLTNHSGSSSGSRGSVSINQTNNSGETPLHVACASKEPVVTTVDNSSNSSGNAASTLTTSLSDVVSFLVKRGCDVDAKTVLGDTAMQIAQRNRRGGDVLLLLSSSGGALRPASRDGRLSRPSSGGSMRRLSSLGSSDFNTVALAAALADGLGGGLSKESSSKVDG